MIYLIAIAACVAADQAANLGLYQSRPLIPGFVELLYVQNTGGGFSILSRHTWLLTALTAVVMAGIAALLVKKVFSHPLAMWTLTLALGGGLGNLIDRVRLGYVVDMFNFQFIRYPVFNVADIFVVVGIIGFAAYYLLLDDKVRGQKETAGKHMEPPAEEQGHGQDHSADGQ